MDSSKKEMLFDRAKQIRLDILEEIYTAASGHPGGSLSCTDILTYLFFDEMNVRPDDPKWEDRDRFVLSKGHAAPALYAVLAEKGYFDKKELLKLRKIDGMLQGHPDMKKTPGIDISTGSLGIGLSNACGMALAGRIQKKDFRVFAVTGDGELEEGGIWEAAMFASHYRLDRLFVFIDANGLQIDGRTKDVLCPEPIDERFRAFGWDVRRINGHDFEAIENALENAKKVEGKPHSIVCDTVKGKGVSFMEDKASWHGSAPNKEQYEEAVDEIRRSALM